MVRLIIKPQETNMKQEEITTNPKELNDRMETVRKNTQNALDCYTNQERLKSESKELLKKMADLEKETLAFFNTIINDTEEREQQEYRECVYEVANNFFDVVQKVCKIGVEKELDAYFEEKRS